MKGSGAPIIDLAELSEDWITTEQAADMLCVHKKAMQKVRGQIVRRIKGRDRHRREGPAGYLWWRRDVEDLARIKKRAKLSLNVALRIMASERPRTEA